MTRRRRWVMGLGALAALQVLLVLLCNRITVERERALLPVNIEARNEPAHDLHVEASNGERFVVRAQSDRFQLVHYWATWCPPCREELPVLIELSDRLGDRLDVWAISLDTDWSTVRRFLGREVPSIVVLDLEATTSRAYGVTELPVSYLIDPQGVIRARFPGAQNWRAPDMQRALDRLVRDP